MEQHTLESLIDLYTKSKFFKQFWFGKEMKQTGVSKELLKQLFIHLKANNLEYKSREKDSGYWKVFQYRDFYIVQEEFFSKRGLVVTKFTFMSPERTSDPICSDFASGEHSKRCVATKKVLDTLILKNGLSNKRMFIKNRKR